MMDPILRCVQYSRFCAVVAGMGDLASLLAARQPGPTPASLETEYRRVMGRALQPARPLCDDQARAVLETVGLYYCSLYCSSGCR